MKGLLNVVNKKKDFKIKNRLLQEPYYIEGFHEELSLILLHVPALS